MKLNFRSGLLDDWRFIVEPGHDGSVWFMVAGGPMSGGLFLTVEQARELASALQSAASAAPELSVSVDRYVDDIKRRSN